MRKSLESLSFLASPWYIFMTALGTTCIHDALFTLGGLKEDLWLVPGFYPVAAFVLLMVMHSMRTVIQLYKEQAQTYANIAENATKELNDVLSNRS